MYQNLFKDKSFQELIDMYHEYKKWSKTGIISDDSIFSAMRDAYCEMIYANPLVAMELDYLKASGITNLRILVGADGPDGVPTRVSPTLQKAPGVYNDTILRGLDRLMSELGKRDMKAVLYLNNSWEWSGGYGMYLEWAGEGKALIPAEVGYPMFMESVSRFVTCDKAKELFFFFF